MLKPQKVGLAVGGMAGIVHVAWSVIVALGWGQGLMDFVTGLHFIQTTNMVMPFDFVTALELVALASIVGYVLGFVFANVWNKVAR